MNQKSTLLHAICIFLVLACFLMPVANCFADVDVKKAELANKALKASLELGHVDAQTVQSKLNAQDFQGLERLLEATLANYKKDVMYESYLQKSFSIFDPSNGIALSSLDAWVKSTGSPIAYAARGIYYAHAGFDVRGTKFIKETPISNVDSMVHLHVNAAKDLFTVLSKDTTMMPVFVWLIQISKACGMPFTPQQVLEKALQQDNRSYYVRAQFMLAISPRWGGSYEQMMKFAQDAATASDLNPRIWSLQGDVYADQGDYFYRELKDYSMATIKYTLALGYGDRMTTLKSRAACHYNLGKFEEAIDDLNKVLYYTPNDQASQQWIAKSQTALARK